MDDEKMAEITNDAYHSLLGVCQPDSRPNNYFGNLLLESGDALLQEDGGFILLNGV